MTLSGITRCQIRRRLFVAKWRLFDICFVIFQHIDTWILWFISGRGIKLLLKGTLKGFVSILFGNTNFFINFQSTEVSTFLFSWFLWCGNRNHSALGALESLWSSFCLCVMASGSILCIQLTSNCYCTCNSFSLPFIFPPLMHIRLSPFFWLLFLFSLLFQKSWLSCPRFASASNGTRAWVFVCIFLINE